MEAFFICNNDFIKYIFEKQESHSRASANHFPDGARHFFPFFPDLFFGPE